MRPDGAGGASATRLRLAALAATLATSAGVVEVLDGRAWLVEATTAALLVAAVGALADAGVSASAGAGAGAGVSAGPGVAGRGRRALVPAAQVAALVVLITLLFVPGQAVLGLLPGPAAAGALHVLVRAAQQAIAHEAAPAPASPALQLVTTAGAGALALLLDVVAAQLRRPALAGLPMLAVYLVLAVLAPGGVGWGWFALTAAGYAVLLAAGAQRRRATWGRTVRSGPPSGSPGRRTAAGSPLQQAGVVVALAVAVLAPALVPGTAGGFATGSVGGSGLGPGVAVDPLIDLRSDLHSRSSTPVLRYRTTEASPAPLRIVTVDAFDGQVWRPRPGTGVQRRLEADLPKPPGLTSAVKTRREHTSLTIERLRQQWLPLPYPATSVKVDGDWTYDERTLNVAGVGGTSTHPGQSYTVDYLKVTPSSQQLAGAAAPPAAVVEAYGSIPAGLPPSIAATARQVASSADGPGEYAQAVALQTWFRSTGSFTYSTKAPPVTSASAVADFLRSKRGYCIHFASAMAIMARTLGIPSRVAVGFLPGTESSGDTWTITLQDAHAWPELYFSGVGWVRFEPTPAERTGAAPDWTVPAASTTAAGGPVAAPGADAPAAGATSPTRQDAGGDVGSSASTQRRDPAWHAWAPWVAGGALAVAVAGALVPAAARALRRRRRWRRAGGPAARAEAAWADLVETLGDLGLPVEPSSTPRQVGARVQGLLQGLVEDSPPELARLVLAVEEARYARPALLAAVTGDVTGDVMGTRPAPGRGGLAVADPPVRPVQRSATGSGDSLRQDARAVSRAVAATRPRRLAWRARWMPPSGLRRTR